jgi:hypothetical protein
MKTVYQELSTLDTFGLETLWFSICASKLLSTRSIFFELIKLSL